MGGTYRVPAFDLEVAAQDENPYKTMEYNQLALQLFQMGFFREDMADQALRCLELMDFKNRDRLAAVIAQGRTQQAKIAALQQQLLQVAAVVDSVKGTTLAESLRQEFAGEEGAVLPARGAAGYRQLLPTAPTERQRKRTREAVRPQ